MTEKWLSITGASSGIGQAYALRKAREGKNLILSGRNKARLTETKSRCLQAGANRVETLLCDLNNLADIGDFVGFHQEIGVIEEFVACAGFGLFTPIQAHDTANMFQIVKVNLMATMLLCKEMALIMLDQDQAQANIAIVSSIAGKIYTPSTAVYAASKAGIYAFAKGMSQDLWDTSVNVTCVLPGPTDTNFFTVADADGDYFNKVKAFSTTPEKVAERMEKAIKKNKTEVTVPFYYDILARFSHAFPEISARIIHYGYQMGEFR